MGQLGSQNGWMLDTDFIALIGQDPVIDGICTPYHTDQSSSPPYESIGTSKALIGFLESFQDRFLSISQLIQDFPELLQFSSFMGDIFAEHFHVSLEKGNFGRCRAWIDGKYFIFLHHMIPPNRIKRARNGNLVNFQLLAKAASQHEKRIQKPQPDDH